MKIPASVKIGASRYKIVLTDDGFEKFAGDSTYLGQISYMKGQISINKCCCPSQQLETLLHEILHGIEKTYGLELEESDITALAGGLHQVLTDNKMLREDK